MDIGAFPGVPSRCTHTDHVPGTSCLELLLLFACLGEDAKSQSLFDMLRGHFVFNRLI